MTLRKINLLLVLFTALIPAGYAAAEWDSPEAEHTDFITYVPVTDMFEELLYCPAGEKGEQKVRLLRKRDLLGNGHSYYLQYGNGPKKPLRDTLGGYTQRLRDFDAGKSRAEVSCAGNNERVFALTLVPEGSWLETHVVRYNSAARTWQVLSLNLDAPPLCVYLSADEAILVGKYTPKTTEDQSNAYILDRHVLTKERAAEPELLQDLPDPKGFQVIELAPQLTIDRSKTPDITRHPAGPASVVHPSVVQPETTPGTP